MSLSVTDQKTAIELVQKVHGGGLDVDFAIKQVARNFGVGVIEISKLVAGKLQLSKD